MFSRYSRLGLALLGLGLYAGAVVAGYAQHPWSVLPVFAALFLLYTAATRKPDLSTAAGWASLAIMAAVQVALVVAAYGLGHLAATLFGPATLPVWPPLALTAAAALFGAWALRDAAEMDVMLDSALQALHDIDHTGATAPADPWPAPAPGAGAATTAALTALRRLDTPDPTEIDAVLDRLEAAAGADAFDPLYDAAGGDNPQDRLIDRALLCYAERPSIRAALIARGEAGLAPMLLLNAPEATTRAAARDQLSTLVTLHVPAHQLPDPVWLAALAETYPGEGFEALAEARRHA